MPRAPLNHQQTADLPNRVVVILIVLLVVLAIVTGVAGALIKGAFWLFILTVLFVAAAFVAGRSARK